MIAEASLPGSPPAAATIEAAQQTVPAAEERPPSTLPDGRRNPAYSKWYYHTPQGKAARAKYLASDKGKAAIQRKQAKREARSGIGPAVKCVECGITYRFADVAARGWQRMGKFRCVCDLCVDPSKDPMAPADRSS